MSIEKDVAALMAQRASEPSSTLWTPDIVTKVSGGLLLLILVTLVLATVLMWRSKSEPDQVIKVFGVTLVVGISAILLVAGYSNEQLTPIIGLFGAIVGYLLGKDTHKDK